MGKKRKRKMTNATETYVLDIDQLDTLLQEEGLQHPDSYRLLRYIWLVASGMYYKTEQDYQDNLWKWVSDEQEVYYGKHESPADFVRYYLENYCEISKPDWLVIDCQATWDTALRHDFYYEETAPNLGYVWADIY